MTLKLATFIGHTSNIHKQVYRLPDDVYQTAKISKLLMLMARGQAGEFHGKALDEIEINLDDDILEIGEDSDTEELNNPVRLKNQDFVIEDFEICEPENDRVIDCSDNESKNVAFPKKTRTLVAWTEEQKKLTLEFFKFHIHNKIPVKRHNCEEMKFKYAGKFENKTWQQIKVFVQNAYRKK